MLKAADIICLDHVCPFVGAIIDHMCVDAEEAPTTPVMTFYSAFTAEGRILAIQKKILKCIAIKSTSSRTFRELYMVPFKLLE